MKIERIESCKWKDSVTSTNLTCKLGGNKPDQDDELNKSQKKFEATSWQNLEVVTTSGLRETGLNDNGDGTVLGVFSSAGIILMFYALVSYVFWLLGGGSLITGWMVAIWKHYSGAFLRYFPIL